MNTAIKKLFSRFIFTNTVLLCILLVTAGSITATQKTEYNMYRKRYSTVSVNVQNEKVLLKKDGKKKMTIDFSALSAIENYSEYLSFSYGGSVYYLLKTAESLFFREKSA